MLEKELFNSIDINFFRVRIQFSKRPLPHSVIQCTQVENHRPISDQPASNKWKIRQNIYHLIINYWASTLGELQRNSCFLFCSPSNADILLTLCYEMDGRLKSVSCICNRNIMILSVAQYTNSIFA